MSIWSDIEDVGKSIGDMTVDTAKSFATAVIGAPVGLVWDLGHINDTFHGGWKADLMKAAGRATDPISNQNTFTGAALAPILTADRWLYTNAIQRPLSTAAIMASHVDSGPSGGWDFSKWGDLFKGDDWGKAYDLAKEQSLGQSITFAVTNKDDPFNYQHPYQETFHKDHPFLASALSGSVDAAYSWYMDPMVLAGKGLSAGRYARTRPITEGDQANMADRIANEDRTRVGIFRTDGLKPRVQEKNGYIDDKGKYVKGWLDGKNEVQILQGLDELEAMPRGSQIASLYAQTSKIENAGQRVAARNMLDRVLMGDKNVLDELSPTQQFISDQLDNIGKGSVTGTQESVVHDFMAQNDPFGLFPAQLKPQNIAEAERQLTNNPGLEGALAHAEDWYAKVLGSAGEGGDPGLLGVLRAPLSPTGGSLRAMARKTESAGILRSGTANTGYKIADDVLNRTVARPIQSLYQWSPSAMPLRVIHGYTVKTLHAGPVFVDSFSRLRPDGVYNLNDAEETWRKLDSKLRFLKSSPEDYQKFANRLAVAQDPGARARVLDSVQRFAAEQIFRKHNLAPEDAGAKAVYEQVMAKHSKANAELSATIKGRTAYSGTEMAAQDPRVAAYQKTLKDQGNVNSQANLRVDQIDDEGIPTALPFLDTQDATFYFDMPLGELDKALRRHGSLFRAAAHAYRSDNPTGILASAKDHLAGAAIFGAEAKSSLFDAVVPVLDALNRTWKVSILMRLGFPLRVVGDDEMRTFAALGTHTAMHNIFGGARNLGFNVTRPLGNAWREHAAKVRLADLEQHLGTPELFTKNQFAWKRISDIEKRISKLKSERRINELKAERDVLMAHHPENLAGAKKEYDQVKLALDSGSFKANKRDLGDTADYVTIDGKQVYQPAPFDGDWGHAFKVANSAGDTYATIGEWSSAFRQRSLARSGHYEVVRANGERGADFHLQAWKYAINEHIRPSEVASRALHHNDTLAFLKSARGRQLRREMPYHSNPERYAGDVERMVDSYLPTDELRAIARERDVTVEDLKAAIPDVAERPAVHGAVDDLTSGMGRVSHGVNSTINGFYSLVGKFNDVMTRSPVFTAFYRDEFARQAGLRSRAIAKAGGTFTNADIEKVAHLSREYAKTETSKILFDMAGTTEAAHYARLIAPFFGAWQEGLNRWWNIVKADPSVARRFLLLFDAPRSLGIVVDSNTGELVQPGAPISDSHMILFQMPEAWGGKSPVSKDGSPAYQSQFKVSESAFNLITQGGGILNPGFGPLVQIPMNQYAVANPDEIAKSKAMQNALATVMPLGTVSDWRQLWVPNSVRTAWTVGSAKFFNHHSTQYLQMQNMLLRDRLIEWGKSHTDANGTVKWPTQTQMNDLISKSGDDVMHMSALRFLSATLSPASIQVQSEFAPQMWAYRRLLDQSITDKKPPFWADEQFIKQYGMAFFPLTQGSSLNHGGLYSTTGTISSIKAHRGLLNEVDPSLYRMVIGAEGEGTYDQTSRNYLYTHQLQPGSADNFVDTADPRQAMQNAIVSAGWQDYTKFMDRLQLQAQSEGRDSFVGSDKYAAMKRKGIAALAAQNPEWFQEYSTHNDAQYQASIEGMQVIASDPTLTSDPRRTDVQVLQNYLRLRARVSATLDWRARHGGSLSPEAQSNTDVLTVFTNMVARMVESNTAFQDYMFNGTIEHDPFLLDNVTLQRAAAA